VSGLGRILLVGAAGQVGRELQRSFPGAGDDICYTRKEVNLAIEDHVRAMARGTEFGPFKSKTGALSGCNLHPGTPDCDPCLSYFLSALEEIPECVLGLELPITVNWT
jgi:hypothetical protein